MNQETLLVWYDRFEKLVERLPGPIQKAVLGEIQPVKELFLEQRPPRILLLGSDDISRVEIVNSIFREQLVSLSEQQALALTSGWETFRCIGRGSLQILEGRFSGDAPLRWAAGGKNQPPDLILVLHRVGGSAEKLAAAVQQAARIGEELELKFQKRAAVIGILEGAPPQPVATTARTSEELGFENVLRANPAVNKIFARVICVNRWSRFRADGSADDNGAKDSDLNELLTVLIDELPQSARLEMARISGVKSAQKKIAQTLVKAATAISAAVGAQPIPLADMPILTTLQSAMVAGIIYISGGDLNLRSAVKFIGALGVNVALAVALRETARSTAKLLPGWGYAISGAVAAAGTIAMGRAAIGFFVDGVSIKEARKLFRKKPPKTENDVRELDDK
ncbi:MAG TPA: hypothetical protein VIT91_15795 [Chthoniobacterales bacterium]